MSDLTDKVKASPQYPSDFDEYVDIESGLRRVAGSAKIYVKILNSFLATEEFDKLTANLSAGDIEAAAATAHGIKGMSGNLSLTKLYNETVAFEARLKQGICEPAEKERIDAIAEKTRAYLKILLDAIA
ncbi:MAG: Hpt domain-containing protein [Clostridiales Family XIII bacterium]|jgi:HPt (histidine-containing phosphotransfer) domain-containing protein|nr:Hpt domain-containing protein [Clostridiales Family XIII bacterium]